MTGLVGGHVRGSVLDDYSARMWHERWYETDRCEVGPFGLLAVHHGAKDPGGHTFWQCGNRIGAIDGAITNRRALGLGDRELMDRVLDDPYSILPQLDGPFCLVCLDAETDRIVVAVDKLGARQCYYTRNEPFAFATSVEPLLAGIDRPQVDLHGISDLLLIGQVWGDRTLVEDIRSLPSGCVLEYADGDYTVGSYREFAFDQSRPHNYVRDLETQYRHAIDEAARTINGRMGLWLSGGLDSRSMAAALHQHDLSVTFSYDSRPLGRDQPLARRVAHSLNIPNVSASLTPDRVLDQLDDGISLVDGLIPWTSFCNLSTVFQIGDTADVVFEACGQGVLLGSGIWRPDAEQGQSAAEILYRGEHWLDINSVERLLSADLDPMVTYREATDPNAFRSDPNSCSRSSLDSISSLELRSDSTDLGRALAGLHRYYFQRGDFLSNRVARSQVGTRVPYVTEGLLSHLEQMPYRYRERTIPFTRGVVPYGCAPLKLELLKYLNPDLAMIPYERSGVAPSRPLWQHATGFVVTTAIDRIRSKPSYGGVSLAGHWYRHHSRFKATIDSLLADACERPFFDGKEIRYRQRAHSDGKRNEMKAIAAITTAERWLQQHVDDRSHTRSYTTVSTRGRSTD